MQRAILRGSPHRRTATKIASSRQRGTSVVLVPLVVLSAIGISIATVATSVVDAPAAGAAEVTATFNASGQCQSFLVPPDVNQVRIDAIGGAGFAGDGPDSPGGKGGDTYGIFNVESGTTLSVIVGSSGGGTGMESRGGGARGHGGGGGDGAYGTGGFGSVSYSGGGGGASFVSTDAAHCGITGAPVDAASVLVVAGGGGGGGARSALGAHGGAGGNADNNGGDSPQDCFLFYCAGGSNGATAGTVAGPGTSPVNGSNGFSLNTAPTGSFANWLYRTGGSASAADNWGGGGGGGWNGGGQGGDRYDTFGGGGGGASYVAPGALGSGTYAPTTAAPAVTISSIGTRRLDVVTDGSGTGTVTTTQVAQGGTLINCGAVASPACRAYYATDTQVVLTATTAPNARFAGWSGDGGCSGPSPVCVATMHNAHRAVATFIAQERLTTTTSSTGGGGGGTVVTTPAGRSCGPGCLDFDRGTSVKVTAVPNGVSAFASWDCDGLYIVAPNPGHAAATPCVLMMSQWRIANARFVENVLKVRTDGGGSGTVVSSPPGISCTATGCVQSKFFPWGSTVTLTATPAFGSHMRWLDAGCLGQALTCDIVMTGSTSALALFTITDETLSVGKIGTGLGSVVSSPAGIDCDSDQGCAATSRIFDQGTVVTLTATPLTGSPLSDSTFDGWSGACSNVTGPCTVTLNADTNVNAKFTLIPRYQLQVTPNGNGAGTITADVGGISCGGVCQQTYYKDTPVTLTATPDSATSHFDGWAGSCSNSSGACLVTMSQVRSVYATFSLNRHTVTVSTAGDGSGTVTDLSGTINCAPSCAADFDHGAQVLLTAHPAAGLPTLFTGWTGPCTNAQPSAFCDVSVDQARSIVATFTRNTHVLAVIKSGTGTGTVTSDLPGIDTQPINCGVVCAGTYDDHRFVTLTATPNAADSRFVGWTGACVTTASDCSVSVDAAASVTAQFERNTLTVGTLGGGSGTVTSGEGVPTIACGADCTNDYPTNTVVTLTAVAAPGSSFTGWSTGCMNSQPAATCDVSMFTARTITATFKTSPKVTVVLAGTGAAQGFVSTSVGTIQCGQGSTTCQTLVIAGNSITLNSNDPTNASVSFDGWSGPCLGTGTCTFTPDDAVVVTATYTLRTNTLTIAKSGTGTGSVASTPAGAIACGVTCTHDYPVLGGLQITATADANSSFVGWSGACTGTSTTCNIANMNQARTATAIFDLIPSYTLTVAPAGTGRGHVTSDVGGINCPGACSASFVQGTIVTLSETTDNSTFDTWSAGCTAVAPPGDCGVEMTSDITMHPAFTLHTVFMGINKKTTSGAGDGTVTSSPAGIVCGATCGGSFETGTYVTLTATPDASSMFNPTLWSGVTCTEPAGAANAFGRCTVLADPFASLTSIGVKFQHKPVAVTVGVAGSGSGSVSGFGAGITCAVTCTQLYTYNQARTLFLTPTADPGSVFAGWSGGTAPCAVSANPCAFNIGSSNVATTAVFNLIPRTLLLKHAGSPLGEGTISSAPVDVNCVSGQCQPSFPNGTDVTLIAKPNTATSQFTGWSGACTNTTGPCTVTMDAAKTVTANFVLLVRNLTAAEDGSGSGTIQAISPYNLINCGATCSATRYNGQSVQFQAVPDPGSVFTGWSSNCVMNSGYCQITMDGDQTVTATFQSTRTLSVATAGSGAGSVTSSPAGIDCGGTCSAEMVLDDNVTLTATPDAASSTFAGWSGECTNTTGDCTVNMADAVSVTATFTIIDRTLQVTTAGTGTGTVTSSPGGIDCGATCTYDFPHGTNVNLDPQPTDALSYFAGWSGDCTSSGSCGLTMDAAKSVTATFNAVVAVPPTNIVASPTSSTSIGLVWDPVPGATSYHVLRSTTSGGSYTEVANPSTTSAADGGLLPATTYFYVVRADTPAGISPDSAVASATTSSVPISGTVTSSSGTPIANIKVTVRDWLYGNTIATATTDAAGHYTANLATSHRVRIQYDDPTLTYARRYNGDQNTWAAAPVLNVTGPTVANETLVVRTGSVQGTVTAAVGGSPLAGITVTVTSSVYGNTLATATTDALGHYQISGVAPISVDVAFVDPSEVRSAVKLPATIVSGTASTVDAVLQIGGAVSGSVTVGGVGVGGIGVFVVTPNVPAQLGGSAITAADGSFTVADIAPGAYKVLFVDHGTITNPRTGLVPVFYGDVDALTNGLNTAFAAAPTIAVISGSTITANQTMVPIVATNVGSSVSVAAGSSTTISATVVGYVPSGTMTFTVNGVATTVTVTAGHATFLTPTTLPAGSYPITIRYNGDVYNDPTLATPITFVVT